MRAAVVNEYGSPDVVHIEEVPMPSIRPDEVLVEVHATSVTAADSRIRGARFPRGFGMLARAAFGFTKPRKGILGGVVSGTVTQVGSKVVGFEVGDSVCGMTGVALGAHAEFCSVKATKLCLVAPEVTHEQAAGVLFGGSTALTYLRDKAKVEPGAKVLVNGASGSIGVSAIQLAHHWGAHVTGVTSTRNIELVKELGADEVIDYTTMDLFDEGQSYDVVLDAVGNINIARGRGLLSQGGTLLLAVASLSETLRARGSVKAGPSAEDPEDFAALLDLIASGNLKMVADSTFTLDDIASAYSRVDSQRKVGNVIIKVKEPS